MATRRILALVTAFALMAASAPATAAAPNVPAIKTRDSSWGTVLINGARQTIYLFDKESSSKPRCYGECAEAWPPVYAKQGARPFGKVRGGLLGTTTRNGGRKQVTYDGHPLYFYAHEGPGQIFCQDVVEFGGTWLLVTPAGEAVPGD